LKCDHYLKRKGARLFSTGNGIVDEKSAVYAEGPKINKETNEQTFMEERLQHNIYMYKIATSEENLIKAFESLKAQCAPGLDGQTKASYTKQMGSSILKLHKDLKKHIYKPGPIKVVHIPKPKGGKRPLGISSVRDKIVQVAFKKELEAIYEPLFYDCSYGFRPKLSCHSALKRIKKK
jgi:retron-type reverse transcriptase